VATTLIHGFRLDNLRGDIFGGLTAAVVALPLALAFGVASGAGPIAGLYGAIAVGLFAALFGGTPAQVSGPTGPMTVVMATIVLEYAHDPAMAFTVVMLGGAFQILFGVFRVGHYVNMMPYPVISGFMTGIGCIIIILQVGPLLGHANPAGGPLAAMLEIPGFIANLRPDALAVGVATLALVLFVPRVVARLVPPVLIALGVGTALALTVFGAAPVLGQVPTGLPDLVRPSFTIEALPGMVTSALVLATLGSLDSLLTSLIADNATRTHHDSNRELIGQGIGNMVAGLIGGLPGAGATMRTVVNVRAGGRTPISGALHALVLLALVLGLAPLAANIPLAALAGILVKVGIDIIDWSYLKRIRRAPREGVIFMLVVLALTVFVNLILAVAAGVVMASLLLVKRMTDIQVDSMLEVTPDNAGEARLTAEESKILEQTGGRLMLFVLGGPINFGAAKAMHQRLSTTDRFDALVLDLSDVPLMDSSASIALEDVIVQVQDRGKSVFVVGMKPTVRRTFRRIGILDILPRRHRAIASRLDGLLRAAAAIDRETGEASD
jgi:SulP family sulfate permease